MIKTVLESIKYIVSLPPIKALLFCLLLLIGYFGYKSTKSDSKNDKALIDCDIESKQLRNENIKLRHEVDSIKYVTIETVKEQANQILRDKIEELEKSKKEMAEVNKQRTKNTKDVEKTIKVNEKVIKRLENAQ